MAHIQRQIEPADTNLLAGGAEAGWAYTPAGRAEGSSGT